MKFITKTKKEQEKKKPKLLLIALFTVVLIGGLLSAGIFFVYRDIAKPLIEVKDSAKVIMKDLSALKENLYQARSDEASKNLDSAIKNINSLNKKLQDLERLEQFDKESRYSKYMKSAGTILVNTEIILNRSQEDIITVIETLTAPGPKINEEYGKIPEVVNDEEIEEPINICATEDEDDGMLLGILKSTDAEIKAVRHEDNLYLRPFGVKEIVKALPTLSKIYIENETEILSIVYEINSIDLDTLRSDIAPIKPLLKRTDYDFADLEEYLDEFENIQELAMQYEEASPQIKTAVEMLPELLGANGPVTYLLVPQNEKEIRASGGLLTAWGLLTVENGEIVGDMTTVDMWDLENYTKYELRKTPGYKNIGGQLALMLRGCGEYSLRAQDSGIYPDNYISMDIFKDYYDIARANNPSKYKAYDHVITFNTYLPTDLIRAVEPLELEDGTMLCANDTAKTIFENTSINYSSFKNRKSYIGQVGDALQDELYDLPARELLKVGQLVLHSVNAKHLSFYSKDEKMQANFDDLNMTARTVKDFDGDYFQFNEAQNCALKANFYIYDQVTQNINIDPTTGRVKKDVTVKWTNEQVVTHDKKEGNILSPSSAFRYRAWIRYFSPEGTVYTNKKIEGMDRIFINDSLVYLTNDNFYKPKQFFDAGKMDMQTYDDIIWFDHRRFSLQDSIKTASHSISIISPENIRYTEEDGYQLLIQKHPGKRAEEYNITISHGEITESVDFKLYRDVIIRYKEGEVIVEDYPSRLDPIFNMIDNVRNL